MKGSTPLELWFQRKPNLKDLHVFGEEVFVHIPKEKRKALDTKARKGYFIGYGDEIKGYRVSFPDGNKIGTARDVVFSGKFSETIAPSERDDEEVWLGEERSLSDHEDSDAEDEPIENVEEQEAPQEDDQEEPRLDAPAVKEAPAVAVEEAGDNNERLGTERSVRTSRQENIETVPS